MIGQASANKQGVVCEELTPQQAGEKYPIMRTDDLVGAVWLPGDGKANPADITQALARGARTNGVRIFEKTRVTKIDTKDGRVTGVQTTDGPITGLGGLRASMRVVCNRSSHNFT